MARKLPLISVVVCSLNGADVISGALKAIKAQKWAGKLEIIVVDDGSTDDTYKIAKSFKGVRVIKNKQNFGIARSRNIGIKSAKGKIVAFTDDDCRPRPTWIKELYAGYTSDKIQGVGGDAISKDKSNLIQRYLSANQPLKPLENKVLKSKNPLYRLASYLKYITWLRKPVPNRKRSVYSLATANVSFRKSAFKKVGMFDERFIFAGEDVDLCKRVNNAYPDSLWFAPKAKVIHQFDSRLGDTLRRSKAHAIGNAQLSRKYRDFLPAIYPFPIVIPFSLLLGLINPWFLLTPIVLIFVIYSLGIRTAVKKHSFEPLIYGYIQFLQECYSNFGFIKGWLKFLKTFSETEKPNLSLVSLKSTKGNIDNSFSSKEFNFSISASQSTTEKQPEKNNKFWFEAGVIALVLGLVLVATLVKSSTVFHLPAAIAIVLSSGYLLLRGFGAERERRLPDMLRLALMATFGVAWLMFFGLIADVVLPVFGFKHPLTSDWLPLIFVIATGLLIPWSLKYKMAVKKVSGFKLNWDTLALSGLLILILVLSFFGARLLNNGYSNVPVILAFGLGLICILLAVLRQKHLPNNMFPIVLFVLSLASVWSYSLRSNYVFGWDIQQEFQVFQTTLASGKWILGATHSTYDAMLSLTILPVTIAKISGMASLTIFKVLSPILYSFVPVFLYYTYQLFAKKWISFLAALLIFAQFSTYMQEFSGLVRQQIGFLFFACILYLILQNQLPKRSKNYLLICSILGLVVAHYTTAYLAIIFLACTYVISKIVFVLLKRYKNNGIVSQNKYVSGWIIVVLIASAFLWYGPATHSNNTLNKLTSEHSYSHMLQTAEDVVRNQFINKPRIPATAENYLQNIGKQYRDTYKSLAYYPNASNATIHPIEQPVIKPKLTLLKTTTDAMTVIIKYGWWALSIAGISTLIIGSYRNREFRRLELGILGAIGIVSIISFVLLPNLQTFYSAPRLSEQVLAVTALPSVLMLLWLLRSLTLWKAKTIITSLVILSFAFASGLVTQFVGGLPSGNMNNFGSVYSNRYIYPTDLASAYWLADRYNNINDPPVYADSFGSIRITSANHVIYNQVNDITPETINVGSFVYADYANIKDGIATKQLSSNYQDLTFQFPSTFLKQHKNLVYSNSSAGVFK